MKNVIIICFTCLIFTISLVSGEQAKKMFWDFEGEDTGGWRYWGTTSGVPQEKAKEIVVLSNEFPHKGKNCLAIKDEMVDQGPYAIVRIIVDPLETYVWTGWIRADIERSSSNIYIGCSFMSNTDAQSEKSGGKDKYLKGFYPLKISLSPEWQKFEIVISNMPPETTHLILNVSPTIYKANDFSATGTVWIDDIEFYEKQK